VRSISRGLDQALLGLAAALTFILTAIVALVAIGFARGLSLLQDAATDSWQRLLTLFDEPPMKSMRLRWWACWS
jgi:hypothetical protein